MALHYPTLAEKDDIRSSDGEPQDNESLLGNRKPSLISFKSNIFWLILHVLVTLGLLICLRVQSRQTTDTTCPKLLPLELRKAPFLHINIANLLISSSLGRRCDRV
jgi:hypothetical protein